MDPADPRFVRALAEFPPRDDYAFGPDAYAEHVSRLKHAVQVPIIASLNGTSAEVWLRYATLLEQAGADALELNVYEMVTDLDISGAAVEHKLVGIAREIKRTLRIPVAVKVSPFFSAFGNLARQLDEAGADALVLFNRFYQPDIDIATTEPHAQLELSTNAELPLRLQWLAILHGRVRCGLAASGGIMTPNDGIKAILAGATVVQLVSALLRRSRLCTNDAAGLGALDGMAPPERTGRHARAVESECGQRRRSLRACELHSDVTELDPSIAVTVWRQT
jgi:dihydroorotate dehydrogenase (fumarate)